MRERKENKRERDGETKKRQKKEMEREGKRERRIDTGFSLD